MDAENTRPEHESGRSKTRRTHTRAPDDVLDPTVFIEHEDAGLRRRGQPVDPAIHDDLVGTRLDLYEIRSLLGRGSMGAVYLAWHERLHRSCAIKVIAPGLVRAEPQRLEMFLSEARSAARLNHPNIVTVHSLGEDRGFHFIEMEYIHGATLYGLLRSQGRLDPLLATKLIGQLAAALSAAHAAGIIHRDVKPDNVMVNEARAAKLADFGLARIFAGDATHPATRMAGTPAYMAPELFRGEPASVASDVYALGVTYFSLLTGNLPFAAESLAELETKHSAEPAPGLDMPLPHAGAEAEELIHSMLAKETARRPATGVKLVGRLHAIANSLISTVDLVALAMKELDIDWSADAESFEFQVPLAEGRRQRVFAEVAEGVGVGERILTVWTPCAPASADHYDYVLQLNGRLPFGAVSVRPYRGQAYFVMAQNHPRATLDPEEIRASVVHMAEWADRVECRITGEDVH